MKDRALLRALEEEIPALEEKLRAMKVTRRRLKAAQTMRANWKIPAFKAKNRDSVRRRNATPEAREHLALVRYPLNNKNLPWPKGSKEHHRYRGLTRKGWTRELAIEKINAEAT